MGKRGAKPKFTDVSCPNKCCKLYGISGKGNIAGKRLKSSWPLFSHANDDTLNIYDILLKNIN